MSIHDLNNLAISKGIGLSDNELKFSYEFVKKNWKSILNNNGVVDLDKYKDKYSAKNFEKISSLYKEMISKYRIYLK